MSIISNIDLPGRLRRSGFSFFHNFKFWSEKIKSKVKIQIQPLSSGIKLRTLQILSKYRYSLQNLNLVMRSTWNVQFYECLQREKSHLSSRVGQHELKVNWMEAADNSGNDASVSLLHIYTVHNQDCVIRATATTLHSIRTYCCVNKLTNIYSRTPWALFCCLYSAT